MGSVKENYQKLSLRYALPDFEELDSEFEISTLDDSSFILRGVISRMVDRADYYATLIESIIQPEATSLASYHECKDFDDDQKNELYQIFKRLMDYNRKSIEVNLSRKQAVEASFICEFYVAWKEVKEPLLSMVKKMRDAWSSDKPIEEELEYFG